MENIVKQYFDPQNEAGFAGARNLLRTNKTKTDKEEIKEWLTKQDAYTLHKAIRRLYYNVQARDQVWEADLMQMTSFKNYNDGISYVLVVIDVLNKYVWGEASRDKTTFEVTRAFKRILDKGRRPAMLQTDRGKKFVGNVLQKFLKENEIQFRVVRNSDVKVAVIERFIRTSKDRMYRYFTYKNTYWYVGVLQQFITVYNKTIHTTIKMPPAAVTIYNAHIARKNLVERASRNQVYRSKPKYKIGGVLISREKNVFEKGAEKSWSEEIFKIDSFKKTKFIYIRTGRLWR